MTVDALKVTVNINYHMSYFTFYFYYINVMLTLWYRRNRPVKTININFQINSTL